MTFESRMTFGNVLIINILYYFKQLVILSIGYWNMKIKDKTIKTNFLNQLREIFVLIIYIY